MFYSYYGRKYNKSSLSLSLLLIASFTLLLLISSYTSYFTVFSLSSSSSASSSSTSYSLSTITASNSNYGNDNSNINSNNNNNNKINDNNHNINNNHNFSKVIILNFYDNPKSQFLNAKPILDKYGFKPTFFVVCNWIDSTKSKVARMTWNDIKELHDEGYDIESHTMDHIMLTDLSNSSLNYEIGQSKKCLADHGVNATVFSPPHTKGWNNKTIIDTIAKYYDKSIGGFATPMYLDCHGWKNLPEDVNVQTDCRTFSNSNNHGMGNTDGNINGNGNDNVISNTISNVDGNNSSNNIGIINVSSNNSNNINNTSTINFANRYDIKEFSHNGYDYRYADNKTEILDAFIKVVNNDIKLNTNGHIVEIPIIGYHAIAYNQTKDNTLPDTFALEMKYLHDNGFKVLNMTSLKYSEKTNTFYIDEG